MTKKFAVLGSPITHSKSPAIHNFMFQGSGFDASYDRFEVADNLTGFLASMREFQGFSLTMPLKEQAFALSTKLDADAAATNAVNTLLPTDAGWAGFNTDVAGIRNAVQLEPAVVCVIGSGATAQSALQAFPNARRQIFARNQVAAQSLAEKYQAEIVDLATALQAELVVSTVTEGVLPQLVGAKELPGTLLDCVYTNPELPARKYVSGLEMLVHQAVIQQRIFQFGNPEKVLEREPELITGAFELLGMAK